MTFAPDRDDRVGRILLSVLAAGFACLTGLLLVVGETSKSGYYVPLGILLLVGLGFVLRGRWRANYALLLLIVAPLPWLLNAAAGWLGRMQLVKEHQARQEYAKRVGHILDSRSPKQVTEDLRKQGQDAWPAVHPATLLARTPGGARSVLRGTDGGELQPLGGIAGVDTLYGNEDGRYLIYRADEHGFHNSPGVWSLPRIDVAAVGDSFTQGASVPGTSNLVAVVRRRWPSTLNLGYGGNGPLIELASLLEYLPQRSPRAVLWVLCEGNDLGEDMEREIASPLLQRYWKQRQALQHLERRQAEIDAQLRDHVEKVRTAMDAAPKHNSLRPFFALTGLRETGYMMFNPPRDHWDTFSEIVGTARDVVHSWQGRLYLVYLPIHYVSHESWLRRRQRGEPEQRRQRVLEIGRRLDIPVIDLEPVFQAAGPQVSNFVYPYPAHFTAAGYEEIGRAIVKRLEADGL